jgi:lipoate-protein ligase A
MTGSPSRPLLLRAADFLEDDERSLALGRAAVRAAELTDRSVSLGVSVRGEPEYARASRSAGFPVLRRSTGGSGVLHLPGDLLWSVVLPRNDPRVGRDFVRAYRRLGGGVTRFLSDRGLDARWIPAPGLDADYCALSARGEVLSVDGRILGGAAQHASGSTLLHQGMIARRVDPELLRQLFGLTVPRGLGRLTGLDELGLAADPGSLARELARALAAEFLGPASAGSAGARGP